ncbi:MAG: hypothetical protein WKF84_02855 [Pyrinomonadaceae bacterium]
MISRITLRLFAKRSTALRQKYAGRRLAAVFEPRSWSSRLADFSARLCRRRSALADYTVIANVYSAGKAAELGQTLSTEDIVSQLTKQEGRQAIGIAGVDEIVRHLASQLRDGDIVAIMSNGGFDAIHEKLLKALSVGQ